MFTTSRRGFLQGTGAIAAMGMAGGCASLCSGGCGKIRLAAVGVMGKGYSDWMPMIKSGLAELVAWCDADANKRVDAINHKNTKKIPGLAEKLAKVPFYTDYRKMLDDQSKLQIQAMTVSTPDHMHAAVAVRAMKMGIHVYVQKPLVRTIWEAHQFFDAAKANNVITQMGNQGSGGDGFRRNVEIVQSGILGDVTEVHVWTNRPIWPQGLNRPAGSDTVPDTLDWNLWLGVAPKRPFKANVYHAFKWRGWFDFGTGAMGDIACHAMSFFWRGLDLRDVVSVETVKTTETFAETYPKATTVKVTVTSGRQSKPVDIYWYDGKTCPPPETCRRLTNGKLEKFGGTLIAGTEGTYWGGQVMMKGEGKFTRHQDHPATKDIPVSLPRVKNHHWEFAEAVRGGARPFSDWDHSVPLTEMVLLGCISQRVKGRLDWDAKANRFRNSDEANALLTPYVRPTWAIG